MFDKQTISEMAKFYRKHLMVDIMLFWEKRTRDTENGGYLTCFDRQGNLTDSDKYIWFQGRQLFMFSALYNRIEKDPKWLDLAKHGRDFVVNKAYAGKGRFNYHLDRQGNVKEGTISIFTDHFVLSGLVEFAVATGSDEDLALITEVYDTLERNVYDPNFKEIYHSTWSPRYKRHGLYMMSLHVADLTGQVLGEARVKSLIDHSLENILYVFSKDEYRALFESVGRDGTIYDEPEGRVLNPGHDLESMWFCIHEGLKRDDRKIVDRAIEVADWAYQRGYDTEYGGIYSFLDGFHGEPTQMDWYTETGMSWADKSFWVHAETLYTLALCAAETKSDLWVQRFLDMHQWCQKYFHDPEFGEWYCELYRDGSPKLTDKGTLWKAAYHVPRSIMMAAKLFEKLEQART
jgi:N-acylglucosamine 2-epimerase